MTQITIPAGATPEQIADILDKLTGPITPEDLTPKQKQLWADTMSYMAWMAPGFRHIFYKLLVNNDNKHGHMAVFTRLVPIAATDGQNILLNPDTFFEFGLKERVFILIHEIQHNVYDDVRTMHRLTKSGTVPCPTKGPLPFDNDQYQIAMDHRINSLLVASRMGSMPKDLNGKQVGIYDPAICKEGKEGAWEIYEKIFKKRPQNKGGSGGGGSNPQGFDMVLSPGKSTGNAQQAQQRNSQQWQVEVAVARELENKRSQGKMGGALQRMFQEILEPEVDWTEHIRTELARKVGSGSYNWRKPDRRFIVRDMYCPGRSGFGAGWIVLWGDTSGSMGKGELERCLAEVAGIIEDVRPKRITILWGDTKVCHEDEVADASDLQTIKSRGVGGGGGTRVMLAFDWLKEQTDVPDVFMGFTDGYCEPFPKKEPAFPVIWASTTDKEFPWGEVVRIKRINRE